MEQKELTEQEFIEKTISQWVCGYSNKYEQAQLLKIILNKIKALEEKQNEKRK